MSRFTADLPDSSPPSGEGLSFDGPRVTVVESAAPVPANEVEPKGLLGTIRNATGLLDLLAQGPAVQTVTSLAERSGLSIATTHRVLRSLAQTGLVRQSRRSQGYGLGPGLVRLSERYLSELPVVRALAPYLLDLRDLTQATIQVCLLVGDSVIAVDRVDGPSGAGAFRSTSRRSSVESAAGQVLLSEADRSHVAIAADPRGELEVAVPVRTRIGDLAAALSATVVLGAGQDADEVAAELARHLTRAAHAAQGAISDE